MRTCSVRSFALPLRPLAACVGLSLLAVASTSLQGGPTPPEPSDEHAWLGRMVGEWEWSLGEAFDPEAVSGTESIRGLGELWVVSRGHANLGGTEFESQMTLGYDPDREAFVGTWVDGVQTHMWIYEGSLDEEGGMLTLDTEGPSMSDPEETARYRDRIEWLGPNEKRMTSELQGPDGEWVQIMSVCARRKQ